MAHGLSCSAACGIFPDQGSNPCPLHWQADSYLMRPQGSPGEASLIAEVHTIFKFLLGGMLQKQFEDYRYTHKKTVMYNEKSTGFGVRYIWVQLLESDIFGFKFWPYLLGQVNCLL